MDRDKFFAELDQLTPAEIEARLPTWDMEKLVLAQEYIDQKEMQPGEAAETAAAETAPTNTGTKEDRVQVSVEVARRAHTTAMMALIFSIGAMLAAIAAAVLAFLALRGATISLG
jgi:hypothetical protein